MTVGRLHVLLCCSAFALGGCGCNSLPPPAETVWAQDPTPYVPRPNSENAFDAYALAALDAERLAASYAGRVSFYPDQRAAITKDISKCVKDVVAATRLDCEFKFVPHRPFKPVPYQSGWRLIGRVFQWNTEKACILGDYDTAISNTVIGTKFGFALTSGGAIDASLGLAIANNVRIAIAPFLVKMSPVQLDHLSKGIKEAIQRQPPITDAIKNEHQNMLLSMQTIQDSLLSNHLDSLQDNMGPDVNESIRFMDQIRSNERKRKAFLADLAKACEEEYSEVLQDAAAPTSKRPKPKADFKTQWKKLPKHLLGTLRPLLAISDATQARTRLLVLYAEILKFGKENKPYPQDLSVFSKDLTIDPFSGASFLYHADQAEFSLYSVGANGRDDGGDTDETYTFPDLKLECSGQ